MSHDAGETWTPMQVPTRSTAGVVIDPLRPSTVFAPDNIRVLPVLIRFDPAIGAVRYASFVDMSLSGRGAVMDPAGAIYVLPAGSNFSVRKLRLP